MNDTITRRRLLLAAGTANVLAVLGTPAAVGAETYPTQSIRFINPFAPGGSADGLSRLMATKLGQSLGRTVFVENVGGAGGTIGSDRVAKSPPDGYTLLLSNQGPLVTAPSLYRKLPYDPVNDFEHIALFGQYPNVLVVGPQVKATTFADFVKEADARKDASPFTFGSAGNGSSPHLCGEVLKRATGVVAQHIPYKGAGPALIDVMGGQLTFQCENISTAIPQVRSGKLRALGVTGATRSPSLPDVPTMKELGYPDFVVTGWYGLSAPARTPRDIVQALTNATVAALADPEVKTRLVELGFEPPPVAPGQLRPYLEKEITRWAAIVKSSGTRLD